MVNGPREWKEFRCLLIGCVVGIEERRPEIRLPRAVLSVLWIDLARPLLVGPLYYHWRNPNRALAACWGL
jgi:hypothetical protein